MLNEVVWIVTEKKEVRVYLSAAARERRDRLIKEGKCLICEQSIEGEVHPTRGNHHNCYQKAMYLIRKGEKTERDFIKDGRFLTAGTGGRKRSEASRRLAEA